ncbi:MAG: hypothetical protein P8Y45_15815, partial [Exilibacterium sp.]
GGNWPSLSEAWMPTPSLQGRTCRRVWANYLRMAAGSKAQYPGLLRNYLVEKLDTNTNNY